MEEGEGVPVGAVVEFEGVDPGHVGGHGRDDSFELGEGPAGGDADPEGDDGPAEPEPPWHPRVIDHRANGGGS